MKHVFKHADLVKVCLRQCQDSGKSAGRGQMYFTGDTIYSYGPHFPIAKIFRAPNGEEVILFTTRTYSMTTTRHIAEVQRAVNHSHRKVVYCKFPDGFEHTRNLEHFKSEMEDAIAKHKKARKPELYTGNILYQATLARDYCEVMCLPVPTWAVMPDWSFVGIDKQFKGLPMKAWLTVQGGRETDLD